MIRTRYIKPILTGAKPSSAARKDWMVHESELDDVQRRILLTRSDISSVVTGCAGSGKSVLALHKAQQIQAEFGNNYCVIVFTRALLEYMNVGRSFLQLQGQFLIFEDFKKLNQSFDYIIVDEVQDFVPFQLIYMAAHAKKQLFFFGDQAQSIYTRWRNTVLIQDIPTVIKQDLRQYQLYNNYRLPLNIAEFIYPFASNPDEFEPSIYKNNVDTRPLLSHYQTRDIEIQQIAEIIKNRNLTDCAILLPTNELVKEVSDQLETLGVQIQAKWQFKKTYNRADYDERIDISFDNDLPKVLTYHSAKGLQFDSVFLPRLEEVEKMDQFNFQCLYVAMSRTYRNLFLSYTSEELPWWFGYLDPSMYTTNETTLEDI